MNQLTKMFEGNQLRIVEQNNEPWFVAKDVCEILEINNSRQALTRLDEDEKAGVTLNDGSQNRNYQAVNEFGLYTLVLSSRKSEAKEFKRWITHEVIPSIRKTGSYQMEQPKSHLEVLQGAINQMVEQDKRMNQLEGQVNNISNIVSMDNIEWRKKINIIIKKIAKHWTGVEPYKSVRNLSYEKLEKRAGCKLDIRLNNRKERAASQGMSKSYVSKINKLDCIEEEKRLVEIYIQVIKEMAIQFRIDINDFNFEGVI